MEKIRCGFCKTEMSNGFGDLCPKCGKEAEHKIGFIRKAIILFTSIGMVCGGGYVLLLFLLSDGGVISSKLVSGCGLLMWLGAYLLWSVFMKPIFRPRWPALPLEHD